MILMSVTRETIKEFPRREPLLGKPHAPSRPIAQPLRRDPRNVEFTQVDEVIESDGGEETAEDSVREVRMTRMSLMNAIKEPSIDEESDIKLAIGNPNVEPNDLLYIISDDNVDHTARASLQDLYGRDKYPKPSRLKATISSLKSNPLKKKSQCKVNMVRADDPPKEDNDAEARSIRVHHTESSITYDTSPFPSEGSMFRGQVQQNHQSATQGGHRWDDLY